MGKLLGMTCADMVLSSCGVRSAGEQVLFF